MQQLQFDYYTACCSCNRSLIKRTGISTKRKVMNEPGAVEELAIQWLDYGSCYSLSIYLGLFHILICKVKLQCRVRALDLLYLFLYTGGLVSGIKIFCLHRFMLMEIAHCRHIKGRKGDEGCPKA